MLKSFISVVAGVVAGVITIMLIESLGSLVHPTPEGFDYNDPAQMNAHVESAPLLAKIIVLIAYAAAAFIGGMVSKMIEKKNQPTLAMVVGVALMIAAIMNFISIPHPIWMIVIGVILFIPFSIFGARMVKTSG